MCHCNTHHCLLKLDVNEAMVFGICYCFIASAKDAANENPNCTCTWRCATESPIAAVLSWHRTNCDKLISPELSL